MNGDITTSWRTITAAFNQHALNETAFAVDLFADIIGGNCRI